MRTIATMLAGLAFAGTFSSSVSAQGLPANISQACAGDYRKLCADVTPGGGRIIACMKAKQSDVSEACKTALRDEQAKRSASK